MSTARSWEDQDREDDAVDADGGDDGDGDGGEGPFCLQLSL